jgi:hypothetical protein
MGKSAPLRKRRVGPTSARFGEEKVLATIATSIISLMTISYEFKNKKNYPSIFLLKGHAKKFSDGKYAIISNSFFHPRLRVRCVTNLLQN